MRLVLRVGVLCGMDGWMLAVPVIGPGLVAAESGGALVGFNIVAGGRDRWAV